MEALAGGYFALVLFGLIAAVLWVILPFAIFGIKPRLDALLVELRHADAHLKAISDQQRVLVEQQKLMIPRSAAISPRDAP